MWKRVSRLITCCGMALLASASLAAAEGIASEGLSLGGASDRECLRRVDEIAALERSSSDYLRVVKGKFTRSIVYSNGSVDFACFPNQVVIFVYFSDAGNARAEADLQNFLDAF